MSVYLGTNKVGYTIAAGAPSGTLSITSNGTYNVTNYASASVAVPTGSTINNQNKTVTPSTSQQSITADSGYTGLGTVTVSAMPTGTATSPTSISGTSASVSTGTNTLTLSKTISVTPRVTTAGYVSSGTAGNSSVSLTASVTTKSAATYTPTTSNQTIASGTYLTGTQTISGDSKLIASNIKKGVSIFGVTGTYEGSGSANIGTKTITPSSETSSTLSFTGLSGEPIAFFLRNISTMSSSSSSSSRYVFNMLYDGSSVKGNEYVRSGNINPITSGYSYTYNNGTLTLRSTGNKSTSPGSFHNSTYELTYIY